MEISLARDAAIWIAQMAQDYNKPVLVIVDIFNRAAQQYQDIEVAKSQVIKELGIKKER